MKKGNRIKCIRSFNKNGYTPFEKGEQFTIDSIIKLQERYVIYLNDCNNRTVTLFDIRSLFYKFEKI